MWLGNWSGQKTWQLAHKVHIWFWRLLCVHPSFDANIAVAPSDVKLGKGLHILYLGNKFHIEREGVSILDSIFIELSIVLNWLVFSVLFLDEEEGWCIRGLRWANVAFLYLFLKPFLKVFILLWWNWIDFAIDWITLGGPSLSSMAWSHVLEGRNCWASCLLNTFANFWYYGGMATALVYCLAF